MILKIYLAVRDGGEPPMGCSLPCVHFLQFRRRSLSIICKIQSVTPSSRHPSEISGLVLPCKLTTPHNNSWTHWRKGMYDGTRGHDYDKKHWESVVSLVIYHSSFLLHTITKKFLPACWNSSWAHHSTITARGKSKMKKKTDFITRRNIWSWISIKVQASSIHFTLHW